MDAQILQELVSIRWVVTGIAVVVAILVVGFVLSMVVNYAQARENVKKVTSLPMATRY
jgi:Mg2+/citrate symporter